MGSGIRFFSAHSFGAWDTFARAECQNIELTHWHAWQWYRPLALHQDGMPREVIRCLPIPVYREYCANFRLHHGALSDVCTSRAIHQCLLAPSPISCMHAAWASCTPVPATSHRRAVCGSQAAAVAEQAGQSQISGCRRVSLVCGLEWWLAYERSWFKPIGESFNIHSRTVLHERVMG